VFFRTFLTVMLFLTLFSSCTTENTEGCITALDCPDNQICVDGTCTEKEKVIPETLATPETPAILRLTKTFPILIIPAILKTRTILTIV